MIMLHVRHAFLYIPPVLVKTTVTPKRRLQTVQIMQTRGKIWRYPHYYRKLTVNKLT